MRNIAVGPNDKPNECSNGCGPMWKVSWREYAETLMSRLDKVAEQNVTLQKKLEIATRCLQEIVNRGYTGAEFVAREALTALRSEKGEGG